MNIDYAQGFQGHSSRVCIETRFKFQLKQVSFFLSFFNTLKQHKFQTGQVCTETSLHRKRISVFPTPLPGPSYELISWCPNLENVFLCCKLNWIILIYIVSPERNFCFKVQMYFHKADDNCRFLHSQFHCSLFTENGKHRSSQLWLSRAAVMNNSKFSEHGSSFHTHVKLQQQPWFTSCWLQDADGRSSLTQDVPC